MECDRCGEETLALVTLHHVKYSGQLISSIVGTLEVCRQCKDEIDDSDRYEY